MDLYSTHIEPIKKIFSFIDQPKISLEFGMGNYSTDFLIKNSDELISIEMQSDFWFNEMSNKFSSFSNWKAIKCLGPFEFLNLSYPEFVDFCFVDGHGDSRPDCINLMIEKKCPVIVAHDTEESGYNWNKVLRKDYQEHVFKDYKNWTTLWTNNLELIKHIKNL